MEKRKVFMPFILFLGIIFSQNESIAQIIFKENFDNIPDWKGMKAFANDVPCVEGVKATYCTIPNWDGWTNNEAWNPYDNVFPIAESRPGLEISSFNYYGLSGKSLTITNEQHNGSDSSGWGSDTTLRKVFPAHYQELYFQFRIKYQPNFIWRFSADNSHSIKTFRFFNWDGTGEVPNSYGTGAHLITPGNFIDVGQGYYGYGLANNFRCSPQATNYDCSGIAPNANTRYEAKAALFKSSDPTHTIYNPTYGMSNDGMSKTIADGTWHKVTLHSKMNTFTGSTPNADGVMEIWYDDILVFSHSDYIFANVGSTAADKSGWNMIVVGGNNYTDFPQKAGGTISTQRAGGLDTHTTVYEAWYAIDDIVVSTMPIPFISIISPN